MNIKSLPFILLVLILWILPQKSRAQLDDDFWFAVPEVGNSYADDPVFLRIHAYDQQATVKVAVPANPYFKPIYVTIGANDLGVVALTDYLDSLENFAVNTPVNRGLHITSNAPVKVYYEVMGTGDANLIINSELFVLKGRHALGTDFYTPFQEYYENSTFMGIGDAWSSIDVVATDDNTTVNIYPTNAIFGHGASPFSVILNKGQTYSFRANGRFGTDHLGGTRVTSDKDIAVTVKDDAVGDKKGFDLIGDQITPVRELGVEHVVWEGDVILLASQDNTTVSVNGSLITTLDAGEQYIYNTFGAVNLLESDKPIYVFQIGGDYVEVGGAQVAHLNCTGEERFAMVRPSNETLKFFILVQSTYTGDFSDNITGNLVDPNGFQAIPNSGGWMYQWVVPGATLVPPGTILKIENSAGKFHVGVNISESFASGRYGYFASYGTLDFGIALNVCDEITLDAGFDRDTYLWSTGDTIQAINVDTTGTYWATVTDHGCVASDTVEITVKPGVEVELRSDTSLCKNDTIVLSPQYDTLSYVWNTGDTTKDLMVVGSGIFWVKATNEYDCSDGDTVYIDPIPFPPTGLPEDTLVCQDELVLYVNDTLENISWYSLDGTLLGTGHDFAFNTTTDLVLYSENDCGIREDTLHVEFREHIIPNIVTPNGDAVNDDFIIRNFGQGNWSFRVFNRWGKQVYRDDAFDGSWINMDVPDQTYLFMLEDEACDQVFKGWFQVSR